VRRRQLWPVFLYIGGGVAVWYETLTDVLGRCVWAPPGDWPTVVDLYGRALPLFANFTYLFYFPVVQVGVILLLERGLPFRKWLTYLAIAVSGAALFELYPGASQVVVVLWRRPACQHSRIPRVLGVLRRGRRQRWCCDHLSAAPQRLSARTPFVADDAPAGLIDPDDSHGNCLASTHRGQQLHQPMGDDSAALGTIMLACTMIALLGHIATKQSMADKAKRDTVADRPVDHPRATALAPS